VDTDLTALEADVDDSCPLDRDDEEMAAPNGCYFYFAGRFPSQND
jgi:hypothetical protein